ELPRLYARDVAPTENPAAGPIALPGTNQPTDEQLLAQGRQQLAAGQYPEAEDTLSKVRTSGMTADQRRALDTALDEARQSSNLRLAATDELAKAELARRGGRTFE